MLSLKATILYLLSQFARLFTSVYIDILARLHPQMLDQLQEIRTLTYMARSSRRQSKWKRCLQLLLSALITRLSFVVSVFVKSLLVMIISSLFEFECLRISLKKLSVGTT